MVFSLCASDAYTPTYRGFPGGTCGFIQPHFPFLLLILAGNDDIGLKGSRQSELKAVSRLPPPSWDQGLRADLKLSEGQVILHLVRGGVENQTTTHSKVQGEDCHPEA